MPISFDLSREAPKGALLIEAVTKDAVPNDPLLGAAGFDGAVGATAFNGDRLLVGLGDRAKATDDAVVRRAAANAARAAKRVDRVATTLPATQATAEGFALGAYTFTDYRGKKDGAANKLREVVVVGGGGARAKTALARGARVAEAVNLARDLINTPGGDLTPRELAARIVAAAKANGVKTKVLDEVQIAKAGLNGLIAVNKGSTHPPRFVELTFAPDDARYTVALVGKGITFDSGGLSLKPSDSMITMKSDMSGAAAVTGALSAARDLGVKVRVRAFLPLTDNMTGGDAQRLGDVIRYRNGATVEVLNTDAEGRLVLADGLISASQEKPDAIVDIATLTGAINVALGKKMAGVFAQPQPWVDQVVAAAAAAGEALWPMPIVDSYDKNLDSKVADFANISRKPGGGAITAALFLRRFVGDGIPWAHLDIAGTAFGDEDDGENPAGATGYGVRTLLELLSRFRRVPASS